MLIFYSRLMLLHHTHTHKKPPEVAHLTFIQKKKVYYCFQYPSFSDLKHTTPNFTQIRFGQKLCKRQQKKICHDSLLKPTDDRIHANGAG